MKDLDKKKKGFKGAQVIENCDTKNDVIYMMIDDGSQNDLILDSTCSFHICTNKELFDKYKPCNVGNIVMLIV